MQVHVLIALLVACVYAQVVTLPSCAQTCILSSMAFTSCGTDTQCLCQDQNYITAVARCIVPACTASEQDAAANYVSSTLCFMIIRVNILAQIQQAISVARVQQGASDQAATAVGNQPVAATAATSSMSARASSTSALTASDVRTSATGAMSTSISATTARPITQTASASTSASTTVRSAADPLNFSKSSQLFLLVPALLALLGGA